MTKIPSALKSTSIGAVLAALTLASVAAHASSITYTATSHDLANLGNIFSSFSITSTGNTGTLSGESFTDVKFTLAGTSCGSNCSFDWQSGATGNTVILSAQDEFYVQPNAVWISTSTARGAEFYKSNGNFVDFSNPMQVNVTPIYLGLIITPSGPTSVFGGATFREVLSSSNYVAPPAAVPIPAAAWLFGSGLLGLIGVARRKARS